MTGPAPDQDFINAATVIKRIAMRDNRHPATAAILLPIAEDLRRRAYLMRQHDSLDGYFSRDDSGGCDECHEWDCACVPEPKP